MPLTKQFVRNLDKFRLITFDVTDTLLKFSRPPGIEYAEIAASHGYPNIDHNKLSQSFRYFFKTMSNDYPIYGRNILEMGWYRWWIQLVFNVFNSVHPGIRDKDMLKIAKELVEIFRTEKCWSYMDGSRELVAKMKESDKTLGIVSNFDGSLARILQAMGMTEFDFIVTAYDCGINKPDKRIFDLALKKCNCTGRQAIHIGNLYECDYVGAREAGWSSILLSDMTDEELKTKKLKRDHVYPDLVKLRQALERKELIL